MRVGPYAAFALIACAVSAPGTIARAQADSVQLSAAQLFALAADMQTDGRTADAEAILEALAKDPDLEIRTEARFRLAQLLEGDGRLREAAVVLRTLLAEKPDAARVRIEMARVLALLGDEAGARRELRQAQAAGLPVDVARLVDQFQTALRSRAPAGGSLEVAVAPDSNINRATASDTVDTIIVPIDLDPDAQQTSGIGLAVAGQGFLRIELGSRWRLVPRLSGSGRFYRKDAFNDVSLDGRVGLERDLGPGARATLSAGYDRRWFGGRPFVDTGTLTLDVQQPLSRTGQATVSLLAARQRYPLNPEQDGDFLQMAGGYEAALSSAAGLAVSGAVARQTARVPGFANWSGSVGLLHYRDIGRIASYGSISVRRLVGDEPILLFPEPRREWLLRASVGATFRQAEVWGLAPVLRLSAERNASTVGIFDYRRLVFEAGVGRAF